MILIMLYKLQKKNVFSQQVMGALHLGSQIWLENYAFQFWGEQSLF